MILRILLALQDKSKTKNIDWWKKHHPDIYEFISNLDIKGCETFGQKVYCYINGLDERPKCKNCHKKYTKFVNINKGFKSFCCRQCSNRYRIICSFIATYAKYNSISSLSDKNVQAKIKQTISDRYNVTNPMQKDEFKAKHQQTVKKHYGVSNPMQSEYIVNKYFKGKPLSEETKQKIITTLTTKYGGMGLGSPIIKNKIIQNLQEHYNDPTITSPAQIDEVKQKISTSLKQKNYQYYVEHDPYIKLLSSLEEYNKAQWDDYSYKLRWMCRKCHTTYEASIHFKYNCPKCRSEVISDLRRTSLLEQSLIDAIREQLHINDIYLHKRDIIPPYEVDIYLPKYKIGIEVNGLYWHSELYKPNSRYHYNKFLKAKQAPDSLIRQLLQFHSDDDITKFVSIIGSKCNIFHNKYHARKLHIRILTKNDIDEDLFKQIYIFFNDNHLFGLRSLASIPLECVAILCDDTNQIIQAMLITRGDRFSKRHKQVPSNTFEIYRFCTKLFSHVKGGVSKLWHHILHDYLIPNYSSSPIKIISYADLSLGDATPTYNALGFNFVKWTGPSLYYTDGKVRYPRYLTWRYSSDYVVKELGLFKFFGPGNYKFEYILNK